MIYEFLSTFSSSISLTSDCRPENCSDFFNNLVLVVIVVVVVVVNSINLI